MNKDMGVLVVHGMGSQLSTYAEPMIKELERRIRRGGKDPERVAHLSWRRKRKNSGTT